MTKKTSDFGSKAIERNPNLSRAQAARCDKGLHKYTMFKTDKGNIMACMFCGVRKGGLKPVAKKVTLTGGKARTKGSLTGKKTDDGNAKKGK